MLESWPNHQRFTGRLDDLFGHRLEFVDLEDALDFRAESMQQAEVPSRDPDDRRDRLGIGKVTILVGQPQLRPLTRQHMPRLVGSQGPEGMHKPNPRIQLRLARQPLFNSRHADQHQPDLAAVVDVAHLLDPRHF